MIALNPAVRILCRLRSLREHVRQKFLPGHCPVAVCVDPHEQEVHVASIRAKHRQERVDKLILVEGASSVDISLLEGDAQAADVVGLFKQGRFRNELQQVRAADRVGFELVLCRIHLLHPQATCLLVVCGWITGIQACIPELAHDTLKMFERLADH